MNTYTTIGSVIDALTEGVARRFNDTRVNDYGKFHDEVRELVTPILEPLGWKYGAWNVLIDEDHTRVLRIDIDRTLDKGSNPNKRGRVRFVWFDVPEGLEFKQGDSIELYLLRVKLAELGKRIDANQEHRERLQTELDRALDYNGELRTQRASLKSQILSLSESEARQIEKRARQISKAERLPIRTARARARKELAKELR